jgi:soluble lytic murein transglycosylase-like protein
VLIAGTLGIRSLKNLRADPTDDFSLTLHALPSSIAYRVMPEKRVTQILEDRLDLFPKDEAPRLARHLLALCKRHRFDPAFILALIEVESRFHIKIVSPYGAVGLMQVMPATAVVASRKMRDRLGPIGAGLDPARRRRGETVLQAAHRILQDPFANLTYGIAYLSWLRDHYRGRSTYCLVAAYNVGPARMDELLSRKNFKPVNTKRYFDAIRRGVPGFRYYRREAREAREA